MTSSYHTIEIILIILALYALTSLMVKSKKISLLTHKRIWNSLLLLGFLISAILGIILALQMDYHILFAGYRTMLWLHVEAGIAMAVISVFHILWHFTYYKIIYKSIFKKNDKL